MHNLRRLIRHRRDHTRVRVPQRIYSKTRHQIQIAVPRAVKQVNTLTALHNYRISRVNGE